MERFQGLVRPDCGSSLCSVPEIVGRESEKGCSETFSRKFPHKGSPMVTRGMFVQSVEGSKCLSDQTMVGPGALCLRSLGARVRKVVLSHSPGGSLAKVPRWSPEGCLCGLC